jgi:hypothetical protein
MAAKSQSWKRERIALLGVAASLMQRMRSMPVRQLGPGVGQSLKAHAPDIGVVAFFLHGQLRKTGFKRPSSQGLITAGGGKSSEPNHFKTAWVVFFNC